MPTLIDKISRSLNEENSEVNRKYWSNYLINAQVNLDDVKAIIHHPHPIGIRFSWMLGNLCALKPGMLAPVFPYFLTNRNNIEIPNFNRSLAKMCVYVELPEKLEGEIMSALFEWLADPKVIVTTKHFCLKALYKLSLKYPEIPSKLTSGKPPELLEITGTLKAIASKAASPKLSVSEGSKNKSE